MAHQTARLVRWQLEGKQRECSVEASSIGGSCSLGAVVVFLVCLGGDRVTVSHAASAGLSDEQLGNLIDVAIAEALARWDVQDFDRR